MFDTLYLDPDAWDFALDVHGNIAVANAPYSIAQDVASTCRLWFGEYIYDIEKGIPYESSILGQLLPINVLSEIYNKNAITVPDVATSNSLLQYNKESRTLSGQIQITLTDGTITNVNI